MPADRHRLVVISVDAMSDVDVPYARTLPNFARVLTGAWGVGRSIYPSVTYPNHVSQITGRTASGHGVYANEILAPAVRRPDWFWDARDLACPTIFDIAAAAGLRTASILWPATAWSPSIDICIPEIWGPTGAAQSLSRMCDAATARGRELIDRHADEIAWDSRHRFGRFATSIACDILRDDAPDALFVHLIDVDGARHVTGRYSSQVRDAFERIDAWIGEILDVLAETGLEATTNVAIVSDHGHIEVGRCFRPNRQLVDDGLIRLDGTGEIAGWDAWVHGCGLTAHLHLNPDASAAAHERAHAVMAVWVTDPEIPIRAVHPIDEMRERYGFDGPFAAVLEGTAGTMFQNRWDGRALYNRFDPDYEFSLSQHGHLPEQDIQAMLAMTGPDIADGVRFTSCTIPDEAVTFAHLLGLEIPNADGRVIREILRG